MTPELKRHFEMEWPALERRLRLVLLHKRVPLGMQDDLLQEVALRLVRTWTTVDKERTWAFTKTILLNLLRDEYRRKASRPENVHEMPDLPAETDIEAAGLARVELRKVKHALEGLSEAHRAVLLQEIGESPLAAAETGPATKMMRMRARRKLNAAVEKISAVVLLRSKKIWDMVHGLVGLRDEALPALGCVLCLIVGAGSTLSLSLPAPAEAGVMGPGSDAITGWDAGNAGDAGPSPAITDREEQIAHLATTSGSYTPADKKKSRNGKTPPDQGGLLTPPEEIPGTGIEVVPSGITMQVGPQGGSGNEDPRETLPTGSPIQTIPVVNPSETIPTAEVETVL